MTHKTRQKFPKGPSCSFPLKRKFCHGIQYLQEFPQVKYIMPFSEGIAVLQVRTLGSSSQFPQGFAELGEILLFGRDISLSIAHLLLHRNTVKSTNYSL